jgi:hypothetical protein
LNFELRREAFRNACSGDTVRDGIDGFLAPQDDDLGLL